MKEDIFDKIMKLPGLRMLNPFYKKHKEVLLYLFFGGLTFIISMVSYTIANIGLSINELIANLISWVLAVLFAFFTNRIWVFQSATNTWKEFGMQMLDFFCGRVATLIVEEIIILVFITILAFNSVLVKLVAQIIVIVLNYVISKFWVFKKK
jgi:putative flippase GtrA